MKTLIKIMCLSLMLFMLPKGFAADPDGTLVSMGAPVVPDGGEWPFPVAMARFPVDGISGCYLMNATTYRLCVSQDVTVPTQFNSRLLNDVTSELIAEGVMRVVDERLSGQLHGRLSDIWNVDLALLNVSGRTPTQLWAHFRQLQGEDKAGSLFGLLLKKP
jgi:hypothetical protein